MSLWIPGWILHLLPAMWAAVKTSYGRCKEVKVYSFTLAAPVLPLMHRISFPLAWIIIIFFLTLNSTRQIWEKINLDYGKRQNPVEDELIRCHYTDNVSTCRCYYLVWMRSARAAASSLHFVKLSINNAAQILSCRGGSHLCGKKTTKKTNAHAQPHISCVCGS